MLLSYYYDLAKQAPCLKASKNLEFRHNRLGYKHYEARVCLVSLVYMSKILPSQIMNIQYC